MADEKQDPLSEEVYTPLVRAERAADALFVVAAILSVISFYTVQAEHPWIYQAVAIGFPISVIALFALSLAIRLYFAPRAQRRRLKDFLSHAFGRQLQSTQSFAYYNNSATSPPQRIAAQTLESAFFTKSILLKMCAEARLALVLFVLLWLVAVHNRTTDPAVLAIAAQLLFSEQIASRYLRLEWLRAKSEVLYDELFRLIQSKSVSGATPVEFLTWYEVLKATSAVSLSTRIFMAERDKLNEEWDRIRKVLNL